VVGDLGHSLTAYYAEPWSDLARLDTGITLALQIMMSLMVSAANNPGVTHLVLPPLPDCSPFCSTHHGIGFDQLFDIAVLSAVVNRHRQDQGSTPMVIAGTRDIMQAAYPNTTIRWVPWTTGEGGPLKLMLLSSLMPSPCLTPYLEVMEKRMVAAGHSNSTQRMCLHNRIEDDFRCWFKAPPGYYTTADICTKLNNAFETLDDLMHIQHIYVAGAYDFDDIIDSIEHSTQRNVVTKRQLLLGGRRGENSTGIEFECLKIRVSDERAPEGYANTFLAVIDWFFCVQSDVFVGNNHSSWSGTVFIWKTGRVYNKLDSKPVVALQYNDISEELQDVLHPFCEPNWSQLFGPPCNYYRL
jgi:hypothetical protein